MAPPPRPQRETAVDTNSAGTPPRHTAGTDGARTEHGALARRKYGLLVPAGTAVDPADAGYQESGEGYGAIGGAAKQARRDTGVGNKTR